MTTVAAADHSVLMTSPLITAVAVWARIHCFSGQSSWSCI